MAEKMRVHTLARTLNVPSKVIVEKCQAEGVTSVKNHMSTLSAGLHATICEWFTEGRHDVAVETAKPVDLEKVRIKPSRSRASQAKKEKEPAKSADSTVAVEPAPAALEEAPAAEPPPAKEPEETPADRPSQLAAEAPDQAGDKPAVDTAAAAAAEADPEAADSEKTTGTEPAESEPKPPAEPVVPAGPQHVPLKARLTGPRVVRYEAPDDDVRPLRRAVVRDAPDTLEADRGAPRRGDVGKREHVKRKGQINPRRSAASFTESSERLSEWGDQDLLERKARLAGATGRRMFRRRTAQKTGDVGTQTIDTGPRTAATVNEPVRMKEFCSATGLSFLQCLKVLRDEHEIVANVNMTLPTETAQLLALHFGIELTVVPSKTLLDELKEEFAGRVGEHEALRPPIVAMLGHVDHGKTSLLDAIRRTKVAPHEDGGITQHIGAYRVDTTHGSVTFLDTPGHAAFTAMRARGADLTDVVVLVVAADDGVMPQTVEAIEHAKAASVPIVVALNKIDLGDQNKLKIFGQLAEHGLSPSGDWGGDTDVIKTSATTGRGVTELLDHLAAFASLLNLRADPTAPATGCVVEAETRPGVGAVARMLVQNGTLRVGDFVVCGPGAGKVRVMLDDRGERVDEAGPSMPVELWGLDEVPAAGDRLYVVDRLQRAKEIARQCKDSRVTRARQQTRKARSLEDVLKQRDEQEVPELQVVIKTDTDGSVAAIRQALSAFAFEEVNLTIRLAGVGAVTDSDVNLAAACGGIIVAFRVDAPTAVKRIAERHGVEIRNYRVIYDLCDDIKKALEGLLAPEERIEPRATVEVRQMFNFGKRIGLVAGCFVVDGLVNRSQFAKIVRDGVVVRDRCRIQSLRRFKDDVKEVRAGLECGVRLEGFDDIHVGDRIETYEVVAIARTL